MSFADNNTLNKLIQLIKQSLNTKIDKQEGKTLSDNNFNDYYKNKLDNIADNAEVNIQADWNVNDITSDAYIKNKPTSLPASDVYDWAKQINKPTYTKVEIGLSNVENKSVSEILNEIDDTLIINKLGYSPINSNLIGVNNGLATLDDTGKVPSAQLPSFIDEIIEGYLYNNKFYQDIALTQLIIAEKGKIYVDLYTDKTYRWSGTKYSVISDTITLGITSTTAFPGDKGQIAYLHAIDSNHAQPNAEVNQNAFSFITDGIYTIEATDKTDTISIVGNWNTKVLYNEDNKEITISSGYNQADNNNDGLMSKEDYIKLLNIETQANRYMHYLRGQDNDGTIIAPMDLYNITINTEGHIVSNQKVVKSDIVALGIPPFNTHYTSKLVVANSNNGTINTDTSLTNGNVYLNFIETAIIDDTKDTIIDNTIDNIYSYNIKGTGWTTVVSDNKGNIEIHSDVYTATDGIKIDNLVFKHTNNISAGKIGENNDNQPRVIDFDNSFNIPTIEFDKHGHITNTSITTLTLMSNPNTDYRVKQIPTTINKNYEILFSKTDNNNELTEEVRKTNALLFNPHSNTLSTTNINISDTLSVKTITYTDTININQALQINNRLITTGINEFRNSVWIGYKYVDGAWVIDSNQSLTVSGDGTFGGNITSQSIDTGNIDSSGKITSVSADLGTTETSSISNSGAFTTNGNTTLNGNTTINADVNIVNHTLEVSGVTTIYNNLITYSIQPYEDNKYNIGNTTKNYKNAYIKHIYVGSQDASWYNGRDNASIIQSTFNQYSPLLSLKTSSGSWEFGSHTDNKLHLVYITDTAYTNKNNTPEVDIVINPDKTITGLKLNYNVITNPPYISNETITLKANTTNIDSFTLNQNTSKTIVLPLASTTTEGLIPKTQAYDNLTYLRNDNSWHKLTQTDIDTIEIYLTNWSWNNGTTSGPTATATRKNSSNLTIPAIPSASGSVSGIVTTGAQIFAGNKTFNNDIIINKSNLKFIINDSGTEWININANGSNGIDISCSSENTHYIDFQNINNTLMKLCNVNLSTGAINSINISNYLYQGNNYNTATNSIIVVDNNSQTKSIATNNGAAYATSANGTLTFGTLPIAQGGTGSTTIEGVLTNLGLKKFTFEKTLTLTTDWIDTGISGTDLETGSYIVQIYNNGQNNTGLWNELFTGFMSWYSAGTNGGNGTSEIILHHAGHAHNNHVLYLRTIEMTGGILKLQISTNIDIPSSSYRFKFRKLLD